MKLSKFLVLGLFIPFLCLSQVRVYEGDVVGGITVLGQPIPQTARVLVEMEGPTNGTSFVFRGKFLKTPPYINRTNWSNLIKVEGVTNNPFRTSVKNKDYDGRCAVFHSDDWSNLTIAASGKITGIDVFLDSSILTLKEVKAGSLTNIAAKPKPSLDALDITGHKSGYKGRSDAKIDQIPITKPSFLAKNMRDKLYMIGANRNDWKSVTVKSVVNGKVAIFWELEDGTVFGDVFEWLKVDQSVKEWHNVHGGILKDSKGNVFHPPKGATVYVCQLNITYTERSPVVKVEGNW